MDSLLPDHIAVALGHFLSTHRHAIIGEWGFDKVPTELKVHCDVCSSTFHYVVGQAAYTIH
jgi:hypothetical protein